ncbi:helix-turn-helix domain-containing protein [Lactococcus lactis]|uniref:helix-turn-helix domain-containing protein n=1 Tax=Lactococcus lactis TaxID=1358 RepID=UPI001F5763F4|nr:helix-turn-helix domain-containing protein [Lactococcus lactis]
MNGNHLFQERLTQAINFSGKSTNQIERELGYPRNTLHNYKMGSEPSATRLMELSQYFQLPPNYLMGVIPDHIPNNLRAYFEQLNEEQKVEMLKITQKWMLIKIEKLKKEGN